MPSTYHISKSELFLASTIVLLVLAITSAASYYFGYQKNIATVKLMEREQYTRDEQYADSLETVRSDNTKLATTNTVICAEYQKLYQHYLDLRSTNRNSNLEPYLRPGSASGNIDPCYGEE